MADPIVSRRKDTVLSPWVTVVERAIRTPPSPEDHLFHSLRQADYVTVLAETDANEIVVVEQYRPALERRTLELPGGLLDAGEDPAACAQRELMEETGLRARELVPLGRLSPDSGRLENTLWSFHGRGLEPVAGWQAEDNVRRLIVPKSEFLAWVRSGQFDHALHIAIVALAMINNRF